MKNPMQLGGLGHYGATLDPIEQLRVQKMNDLVDEWNSEIPSFEDPVEQKRYVLDWEERLRKVKSEEINL